MLCVGQFASKQQQKGAKNKKITKKLVLIGLLIQRVPAHQIMHYATTNDWRRIKLTIVDRPVIGEKLVKFYTRFGFQTYKKDKSIIYMVWGRKTS